MEIVSFLPDFAMAHEAAGMGGEPDGAQRVCE